MERHRQVGRLLQNVAGIGELEMLNLAGCILRGSGSSLHRLAAEGRMVLRLSSSDAVVELWWLLHPRSASKDRGRILLDQLLRQDAGLLLNRGPLLRLGRHDPVLALPLHLRDSLGRQRHGSWALRSSCSPLKEPLQLLVLLLAVACGAISFSHLREFGLGLKGELLKQFATELLLLLIDGMLLAERRHRLFEFSVTERVQALQTLDEPACVPHRK